jgi:hypothetical protein
VLSVVNVLDSSIDKPPDAVFEDKDIEVDKQGYLAPRELQDEITCAP